MGALPFSPIGAVTVRQAVSSDLEVLVTLFDRYRQFQGQTSDRVAARAFLAARFEQGESIVFIAHAGGAPVGLAQLYPSYSSVALARVFVLNDLFVEEAARRIGVASKMLAAVQAHAWAHGAARVTLNVARDNASAQALYQAQGWQQDTKFFMYHRFPAATDPSER